MSNRKVALSWAGVGGILGALSGWAITVNGAGFAGVVGLVVGAFFGWALLVGSRGGEFPGALIAALPGGAAGLCAGTLGQSIGGPVGLGIALLTPGAIIGGIFGLILAAAAGVRIYRILSALQKDFDNDSFATGLQERIAAADPSLMERGVARMTAATVTAQLSSKLPRTRTLLILKAGLLSILVSMAWGIGIALPGAVVGAGLYAALEPIDTWKGVVIGAGSGVIPTAVLGVALFGCTVRQLIRAAFRT